MAAMWEALTSILQMIGNSSSLRQLLGGFRVSTGSSSGLAKAVYLLMLAFLSGLGAASILQYLGAHVLMVGGASSVLGLAILYFVPCAIAPLPPKRGSSSVTSSRTRKVTRITTSALHRRARLGLSHIKWAATSSRPYLGLGKGGSAIQDPHMALAVNRNIVLQ